jgi:CRP-like cAMP-binding protein
MALAFRKEYHKLRHQVPVKGKVQCQGIVKTKSTILAVAGNHGNIALFALHAAAMSPLLNYLEKFHPLSPEAKAAITAICKMINIGKGKDLQPIGHTCKTIYFIQKGIARIYYYKDRIDITESFAFENSLVARVESLFTGKPSKKAIQILEDAEIVAIDAQKLFLLYNTYHEIETLFRKIFEASHVDTVNRLESIQFHTAEERYKTLLAEQPDLIRRVPLKYIASYLGITQVSLSRIRSQK